MTYHPGMSTDRDLAKVRYEELLQEAAQQRADQASGGVRRGLNVWLALIVVALVMATCVAWMLIAG